jgi:phage/plasmid-associated DNA primase
MSGNVAYNENEIVNFLYSELNLGAWWKELLVFDDNGEINVENSKETIAWSETRTAKMVAEKFGPRLSYVEVSDQWYAWNGTIHVPCEGVSTARKLIAFYVTAVEYALEHVENVINAKAQAIKQENKDKAEENAKIVLDLYKNGYKKHRDFRNRMNSNAGITSVIATIQTEVSISSKYYENDHDWFVMRNCVMDLKKFREGNDDANILLPHDPARPVTRFFDADYDLTTNLGHWDSFMNSSLPVFEIREYLQNVVGAAFMAQSKTKVICNLLGKKDSGKSIFIGTFYDLCTAGAGYASMPDPLSIMKVQGQNFSQDKFRGMRLIACSEPDEHQAPDTPFLKRFSGDDLVESANKYAKMSGWKPQGILFIASNNHLKIDIRDNATVDRIKIVEFPNQFLPAGPGIPQELEQIPDIKEKISADRNRVLMWVIEGMLKFRANGFVFDEPQQVVASQDAFVANSSSALEWVTDMMENELMVFDLDEPISKCLTITEAFQAYMYWCKETNTKAMSRKFFVNDLVAKYGETKRSSGIRLPGFSVSNNFKVQYLPETTGYMGQM